MNTLQESLFPYLLKEYLIISIYFFAVTVFVLFLVLVFHKLWTEKRARQKQRYTDDYRAELNQYLKRDMPFKEPKNNLQFKAYADVCIDHISNIPGDKNKINLLLKQGAAVEHFKNLTASSSWTDRYSAIETLGFFMMDDLRGFYMEIISADQSPEVKAKAVWALSLIADKEDLDFITSTLLTDISHSSKFNVYIYTNVICSYKRVGAIDVLIRFLDNIKEKETVPLIIKRDLIEACGAEQLKESAGVIHKYVAHYPHDPLMRIACIRALGGIGEIDVRTILNGLTDDDWRIRAVTAKAVYEVDDTVISGLQRLLYDSVYIVRINAARKLAKLGGKGLLALKGEMNSQDRFVKDTIGYILDEAKRNV
jgi:HEAT repeat protein